MDFFTALMAQCTLQFVACRAQRRVELWLSERGENDETDLTIECAIANLT